MPLLEISIVRLLSCIKSLLISEQTDQNVHSNNETLFDSIQNMAEMNFASLYKLIGKYLLWIYY